MKFFIVPYHTVQDQVKNIIADQSDYFENIYGELNVDWNYFQYLSTIGKAFVCLAVNDNEVVGLAGFTISENAHHSQVEADNVVIFLEEKHRGKNSIDLLDFCKESLKKLGVSKINFTLKDNAIGKFLEMNKFKPEYKIWSFEYE